MATISVINSRFKNSGATSTPFEMTDEEIESTPQFAYHEMADVPMKEVDVLDQLEQNIAALENMRSRFQFVMKEIRYLMKVD